MYAVLTAYTPAYVAILGHHLILLGVVNFFFDFIKAAAQAHIKRCLCGGGESMQVYEPVWTELTDVLPA